MQLASYCLGAANYAGGLQPGDSYKVAEEVKWQELDLEKYHKFVVVLCAVLIGASDSIKVAPRAPSKTSF
jgi:hypothetical protein